MPTFFVCERPSMGAALDALEVAFLALGRLGNNSIVGSERDAWERAGEALRAGRIR